MTYQTAPIRLPARTSDPTRGNPGAVRRAPSIARQNGANLVFIAVSCLSAHLAPYATLLAAYAVLGPAHYLTEIGWLHDRRYFARGGLAIGACLAVLALLFVVCGTGALGCAALAAALSLAVASSMRCSPFLVGGFAVVGGALGLLLGAAGYRPLIAMAVLVPTFVHVLCFTIGFIVRGARRSKSVGGWVVAVSATVAAVSFCVVPSIASVATGPHRIVVEFFGPALQLLDAGTGILSPLGAAGLLAFGYTYHYLNWFAKTPLIGWHRQGNDRLAIQAMIFAGILLAYAVDFRLGFLLSLPLSVVHVFLEFPLNAATFGLARPAVSRPA